MMLSQSDTAHHRLFTMRDPNHLFRFRYLKATSAHLICYWPARELLGASDWFAKLSEVPISKTFRPA